MIHLFSQERSFAVQLNKPLDPFSLGVATKSLPIFSQGCWADYFFLAIHTFITTTAKTQATTLHENFLIALTNVSPYIKSLTVVSVNKLMSLFTSYSNAGFMLANENNHKMIFYIIDIFNNMVQYQISGNCQLVYALVRFKTKFHELEDLSFEDAVKELTRLRELRALRISKLEQAGVSNSSLLTSQESSASLDSKRNEDSVGDKKEENGGEGAVNGEGTKTELSEKAKGKLPAEPISPAAESPKKGFQPTAEWVSFRY
jgi:hypothetical protein